ncbi:MAG: flavodoxin family protein, partial [Oribacterium sp.]|nr:flavodoxin family protein [Oribacterium sp.]
MIITVLLGSPNKKGSTSILVDEFKRGAEESGHTVEILDVCHMIINPCIGCVKCGYEGPCVQKDDTEIVKSKLL